MDRTTTARSSGSASKTVALTGRKALARVLAGALEISKGLYAMRVNRYRSSGLPCETTSASIVAEQIGCRECSVSEGGKCMHKTLPRSVILSLMLFAAIVMGACGLSGVTTSKAAPPPPSVHTVSNTASFSHEGTNPAEVAVACPANELVLGGGYKFEVLGGSPSSPPVPFVYVTASLPSGNGWKVSFSYTMIANATVYVQCLVGGTGSVSVQSASLDFPTSPAILGTGATCPTGSTVVGGGFAVKSGIVVVEDFPRATTTSGWGGSFRNGTTHDFLAGATVYANCYSLMQPLTITRDHRVTTGVDLYEIHSARLETGCKAGTALAAGGYMRASAGGTVYTTAPNPQGAGWDVVILNRNVDVDVSGLTAVIACVAF
jgi:hypothetical protein